MPGHNIGFIKEVMLVGVFGANVDPKAVCIFPEGFSKNEALDSMVDAINTTGAVTDVEALRKAVYDREAVMSTGIGQGVAIPHVRIDEVEEPAIGVGISAKGVDFDTLDNEPVHIIVLFAMPSGSQKDYLGLLAKVMMGLKLPGFQEKLLSCKSPDEAVAMLNEG